MDLTLLNITEEQLTPLVSKLIAMLEEALTSNDELKSENHKLVAENQVLKAENQILKDEIAAIKKSSKRPKPSPSKKPKPKPKDGETPAKRAGSAKKSKKDLPITRTETIRPDNLPEGSKLVRTRNYDVQDLKIIVEHVRYILEVWKTPDGEIISGEIPEAIAQKHFGTSLCAYAGSQNHMCQVTQGLLLEQLRDFGLSISAGQLNNILLANKDKFHKEKQEVVETGLLISPYVQVDDTGARHNGKSGYCTHLGNELFASFHSSFSKSRINFLGILNRAFSGAGYTFNDDALRYAEATLLPAKVLKKLADLPDFHITSRCRETNLACRGWNF